MPVIASRSLHLGAVSALCILAASPVLAAGDADAPVFFLLTVKCPAVGAAVDAPVQTLIL